MTLKVPPFKPIIVRAGEAIGWPQIQRFLDANREKQPDPETPGEEADVLLTAQRFKPISVHGFGRDGRALTMDEAMRVVYVDNGKPVITSGQTMRIVLEPVKPVDEKPKHPTHVEAWYSAVTRGAALTPSPTTQETPVNAPTTKTTHIEPTVGRKLWLRATGTMAKHMQLAIHDPAQPLDATIVFAHPRPCGTNRELGMLQNILVRVHDHGGNAHNLSVPLRQEGDPEPASGLWAEWMPYQTGQARKERTAEAAQDKEATERAAPPAAPAVNEHASNELYPAIRQAMKLIDENCMPGFNFAVDKAYNVLHRAFWSEAPAPASEPGLRPTPWDGAVNVDLAEMNTQELERALREPVRFTADAAATTKAHYKPGTIVRLATGLGPTMTVDGDGSVMWFNDKEVLMRDTIPVACLTLVKEPQTAVPPVATAAAVPPTFGFDLALQLMRDGKTVRRASWESTGRLFLHARNHSEFTYYDDFSPRRPWAINPSSVLANDWTLAE